MNQTDVAGMGRRAFRKVGVVTEVQRCRATLVEVILAANPEIQIISTDRASPNIHRFRLVRRTDEITVAAWVFGVVELRRILNTSKDVETIGHTEFRIKSDSEHQSFEVRVVVP